MFISLYFVISVWVTKNEKYFKNASEILKNALMLTINRSVSFIFTD